MPTVELSEVVTRTRAASTRRSCPEIGTTRGGERMSSHTYHFEVGNIDCFALSDGTFVYGPPIFPPAGNFLFVNAPKRRLERRLEEYGIDPEHWETWTSDYTCLLVDTGEHRVLIDPGAGTLGADTGRLFGRLHSAGVEAGEIDYVILTHGHPDHLGGAIDSRGSVVFPEAQWIMSRIEWDFWMEGEAERVLPEHVRDVLVGSAHRSLSAIRERISLVPGEEEILPGIRILPAPGHTPGHVAVAVSSAGEELLCVVDLVLHPIHLQEPEWLAAVDMLPDQLVATRDTLLGRAAVEKSLVMAFHFPFPGLGHVSPMGVGWQWEPLEAHR
jgi:glyoxylase-like metal-dependent hydrolase (beta-lactamase superfamily II)